LRLPALRGRREDVPMLARHFLLQSAEQWGVEPKRISEVALDLLETFQFPGNVRQLENICHWLTVMAPAQVIESKDLPPEVIGGGDTGRVLPSSKPLAWVDEGQPETVCAASVQTPDAMMAGLRDWESELSFEALSLLATDRQDVWDVLTQRFETCLIQAALSTTRGRRIEAALKLGIGRNTITRKIQELGIGD
jgi:two-component system nitrogen regulation response regulator GlnG